MSENNIWGFDKVHIEVERENDGRFVAEVVTVPGAMAYGDSIETALVAAVRVAREAQEPDIVETLQSVALCQEMIAEGLENVKNIAELAEAIAAVRAQKRVVDMLISSLNEMRS